MLDQLNIPTQPSGFAHHHEKALATRFHQHPLGDWADKVAQKAA